MEYSKLLDSSFDSFMEFNSVGNKITPEMAWDQALSVAFRIGCEYLTKEQKAHFLNQLETIFSNNELPTHIKETTWL
jgi:hypothetical protein